MTEIIKNIQDTYFVPPKADDGKLNDLYKERASDQVMIRIARKVAFLEAPLVMKKFGPRIANQRRRNSRHLQATVGDGVVNIISIGKRRGRKQPTYVWSTLFDKKDNQTVLLRLTQLQCMKKFVANRARRLGTMISRKHDINIGDRVDLTISDDRSISYAVYDYNAITSVVFMIRKMSPCEKHPDVCLLTEYRPGFLRIDKENLLSLIKENDDNRYIECGIKIGEDFVPKV